MIVLSAAIIVRNEADHLRRCLTSIAGVVDEIIVVDTGSTDGSVEVALSFGAVVVHHPWDDDFGTARNAALDRATGEWILYIDADEVLEPLDVDLARATLRDSEGVLARRVLFATRVGWTPFWEYRLWKHRPDIRFRGKIHETIVPDLLRISAVENLTIESSVFHLQHYGYEGDQTFKHHRNLPMLREQVAITPDRVFLWSHLGRVLDSIGQLDEARVAFETGVGIVRRKGLAEKVDILAYGDLALFLLGIGEDVFDLLNEAEALVPDFQVIHWIRAKAFIARGDFAASIPLLHRLLDLGAGGATDGILTYNARLFGEWPANLLAESYFELGHFAFAAGLWCELARIHGDPAYRARGTAAASLVRRGRYRPRSAISSARTASSSPGHHDSKRSTRISRRPGRRLLVGPAHRVRRAAPTSTPSGS